VHLCWTPFAALPACGQIVDSAAKDAESVDTSISDASTVDSRDVDLDSAETSWDRWTPCGEAPLFGEFTCCNGLACNGTCSNGACWCQAIKGGCTDPQTVCCGKACTTEEICAYWHQQ